MVEIDQKFRKRETYEDTFGRVSIKYYNSISEKQKTVSVKSLNAGYVKKLF